MPSNNTATQEIRDYAFSPANLVKTFRRSAEEVQLSNLHIKMNLRVVGWGGMDRIDVAHDRDQWRALANTVINLRVPQNVENFLSSCTTGGFSRSAQLY
jgi:hypothetical protein